MAFSLIQRPSTQYRGRFAPSPSGLLHFGSLLTALASYLDAKANDGLWLVRIEDIDPPREQAGAADEILRTLVDYGLHWDEHVRYQSQQSALYEQVLSELAAHNLTYACACTRAQIKASGGIYSGRCQHLHLPYRAHAVRIRNQFKADNYQDLIQGKVQCDPALASEDFIIKRKDGLYAYQLAVVSDDINQGITHIVRGCDLLEPTARQLTLYQTFGVAAPQYAHVPLITTHDGYKLSKQNKAPAIDRKAPQASIISALEFLGQQPPAQLNDGTPEEILAWAVEHWQLTNVPKQASIALPE
ncbi:tRNA glutamyl-Q(34) synthetase GluQRS [Thalassotalea euphylliae]|uniref:Glutamyl-Q tRNA(Asp) synthetase n=1 Tax=Thalassotalea euphylliae TaxID=1655234 RepID=A0A3E0U4D1_9GAMM|nr:tRNA glutamyl-Q(34) synthetase GluQRS [Thalassotalea euphylliae]REL31649.1 tRNA glutamyl-Q(34) synthetase GluQRS [Thalassotalea euphylliae]